MLNGSFSRRVRGASEPHSPNSNKPFNIGDSVQIKIGDLVRLHPDESKMMGFDDRHRVGLVVEVRGETQPRTISVLWHGDRESYEEYEDGLILFNGGC